MIKQDAVNKIAIFFLRGNRVDKQFSIKLTRLPVWSPSRKINTSTIRVIARNAPIPGAKVSTR
jgi:hypothetical protein